MLVAGAVAQQHQNPNEIRDRGQVPLQPRIDGRAPGIRNPQTLHGILVDASCKDRSAANLRLPSNPEFPDSVGGQPTPPAGGVSAKGVTVDPGTAEGERADIVTPGMLDLKTRQQDPNCAISGSTSSLAVLLDNGHLLNLDEGGNTMAIQAVQANPTGKAMLNGSAPPFKPWVTLIGRPEKGRLFVQKIVKLQ
jgi:hypothetical protein